MTIDFGDTDDAFISFFKAYHLYLAACILKLLSIYGQVVKPGTKLEFQI